MKTKKTLRNEAFTARVERDEAQRELGKAKMDLTDQRVRLNRAESHASRLERSLRERGPYNGLRVSREQVEGRRPFAGVSGLRDIDTDTPLVPTELRRIEQRFRRNSLIGPLIHRLVTDLRESLTESNRLRRVVVGLRSDLRVVQKQRDERLANGQEALDAAISQRNQIISQRDGALENLERSREIEYRNTRELGRLRRYHGETVVKLEDERDAARQDAHEARLALAGDYRPKHRAEAL